MSSAPGRSRVFFWWRVTILLCILLSVVLWAWRDIRARERRNHWDQSLNVALVVLQRGELDRAAVPALNARIAALEERLTEEFLRYHQRALRPVSVTSFGPVLIDEPPPNDPGEGVLDLARFSFSLWRYLRNVDALAEVPAGFDSKVYLVARPIANQDRKFVEGLGQEGGRIGVVSVELDATMSDFALFVATHELFHTLGASDKYDAQGHTLIPGGLAYPDVVPMFPQPCAEVMARNLPLSAKSERPPRSLDELCIGPVTAKEIGWLH
jgi:hypothetical protein